MQGQSWCAQSPRALRGLCCSECWGRDLHLVMGAPVQRTETTSGWQPSVTYRTVPRDFSATSGISATAPPPSPLGSSSACVAAAIPTWIAQPQKDRNGKPAAEWDLHSSSIGQTHISSRVEQGWLINPNIVQAQQCCCLGLARANSRGQPLEETGQDVLLPCTAWTVLISCGLGRAARLSPFCPCFSHQEGATQLRRTQTCNVPSSWDTQQGSASTQVRTEALEEARWVTADVVPEEQQGTDAHQPKTTILAGNGNKHTASQRQARLRFAPISGETSLGTDV